MHLNFIFSSLDIYYNLSCLFLNFNYFISFKTTFSVLYLNGRYVTLYFAFLKFIVIISYWNVQIIIYFLYFYCCVVFIIVVLFWLLILFADQFPTYHCLEFLSFLSIFVFYLAIMQWMIPTFSLLLINLALKFNFFFVVLRFYSTVYSQEINIIIRHHLPDTTPTNIYFNSIHINLQKMFKLYKAFLSPLFENF